MRYFLIGPTASGKTAVSIQLAHQLNAEILSMDSMLVYRGMDIGTAKPSIEEREGVPHHLMDLIDPSMEFSTSKYLECAKQAEIEISSRGKNCLYVGGTGLYFKSLLFGMFEGPDIPPEIRGELEAQLMSGKIEELRDELKLIDPPSFEKIHPNDHKRLLRSLETFRATGRPLSDWQNQWEGHREIEEPAVALEWERSEAHLRVEKRFQQMMDAGLLKEINSILGKCGIGRSARQAIGYKQLLEHIEEGLELEVAIRNAETATRRLIRRQTTWLGNFPGICRVQMTDQSSSKQIAQQIADIFNKKSK